MNPIYLATSRLLTEVSPIVFESGIFALKGGTAINLFLTEMPRLSVDLDLVFTDHRPPRTEALAAINKALRGGHAPSRAQASLLGQPVQPSRVLLEPLSHESAVVEKAQLVDVLTRCPAHRWQFLAKPDIPGSHRGRAGDADTWPCDSQPVAYRGDGLPHFIAVSPDVLARDVGTEDLIAIRLTVQNEAGFSRVLWPANRFEPKKMPSSKGMLNLGSLLVVSSVVREGSWMPYRQSLMIWNRLSSRTWLPSSLSREQRATMPLSCTAKTSASNSFLYRRSKGTLMKTESL